MNLPSLAGRGAAPKSFPVGPLPVRLYPSVAPGAASTRLPWAPAACLLCRALAETPAGPPFLEEWSRVLRIFRDSSMAPQPIFRTPGCALGTLSSRASPDASPGAASPWLPRTRWS